ncbi:hypothetical protein HAX54_032487 [Datura stramonium]|uniref:Secreted protein n=1 Tax=Datura stramonium TaxID=4076 RepID=A0ABS8VDN7_DATST|nr:hypothetical protein [Datura stramonium]
MILWSFWFRGTAIAVEFLLQRDRGGSQRPTVTNHGDNRQICYSGFLTAIAGPLQQKCDRCCGRRESESAAKLSYFPTAARLLLLRKDRGGGKVTAAVKGLIQ